MLDVLTTRVAYVKVTPTICNWIQPIAIKTTSRCGLDLSQSDRNPVASVDSIAVGSRSDHNPVASVDRPKEHSTTLSSLNLNCAIILSVFDKSTPMFTLENLTPVCPSKFIQYKQWLAF